MQLPVLIACNHVLKYEDVTLGKKINLQVNDKPLKTIVIDENRRTFTNNEYDITFIEIKEKDGFNINKMLEIDNDIDYESKLEDLFKGKSIYIIHYPYGISSNFSPGLIEKIENNIIEIYHTCSTENGSSETPIINLKTFKVIGIHLGKFKNESFNCGNILKKPLDKFYILKWEKSTVSIDSYETDKENKNDCQKLEPLKTNNIVKKNEISFLLKIKKKI